MSEEDVGKLGNDEIVVLSQRYGQGDEPYIEASETHQAWAMLKIMVRSQHVLPYRVTCSFVEHHQHPPQGCVSKLVDPGINGSGVSSPHCRFVCLKVVLSKVLGYGIIVGSILVKVPQIMKILKAKSGEGINMFSTTLELTAIAATMAYSYSQGFPFSSYGEAVFLLIQTLITAFLVMYYTDRRAFSVVYMSVFAVVLSYLMSPFTSRTLLWALQASVLPNIIIARRAVYPLTSGVQFGAGRRCW
ncbi:hypothetical protein LSH36_365g03021 [Paralvinella palmiformis]|uniref:Mannose-P-dolichol utilization defect 1 protein n=1 Tax=Paralvinella palmiformis TaxID=53620 RepID=A0AAD9JFI9_9ANNE|nr:hypothetical protein LSH36_365g03021 [Paralvinella palmiformis]